MRILAKKTDFLLLVCMVFCMNCGSSSSVDDEEIGLDIGPPTVEEVCAPGDGDCYPSESAQKEPVVVPEQSIPSCPGYKAHDNFPAEYEEFCQQMVTQDLLATGDKCFFVPNLGEAGCFCSLCALKGSQVKCVSEECN